MPFRKVVQSQRLHSAAAFFTTTWVLLVCLKVATATSSSTVTYRAQQVFEEEFQHYSQTAANFNDIKQICSNKNSNVAVLYNGSTWRRMVFTTELLQIVEKGNTRKTFTIASEWKNSWFRWRDGPWQDVGPDGKSLYHPSTAACQSGFGCPWVQVGGLTQPNDLRAGVYIAAGLFNDIANTNHARLGWRDVYLDGALPQRPNHVMCQQNVSQPPVPCDNATSALCRQVYRAFEAPGSGTVNNQWRFHKAFQACESDGGWLATVRSGGAWDRLKAIPLRTLGNYWLGGSNALLESQYRWVGGGPASLKDNGLGEVFVNQNCVGFCAWNGGNQIITQMRGVELFRPATTWKWRPTLLTELQEGFVCEYGERDEDELDEYEYKLLTLPSSVTFDGAREACNNHSMWMATPRTAEHLAAMGIALGSISGTMVGLEKDDQIVRFADGPWRHRPYYYLEQKTCMLWGTPPTDCKVNIGSSSDIIGYWSGTRIQFITKTASRNRVLCQRRAGTQSPSSSTSPSIHSSHSVSPTERAESRSHSKTRSAETSRSVSPPEPSSSLTESRSTSRSSRPHTATVSHILAPPTQTKPPTATIGPTSTQSIPQRSMTQSTTSAASRSRSIRTLSKTKRRSVPTRTQTLHTTLTTSSTESQTSIVSLTVPNLGASSPTVSVSRSSTAVEGTASSTLIRTATFTLQPSISVTLPVIVKPVKPPVAAVLKPEAIEAATAVGMASASVSSAASAGAASQVARAQSTLELAAMCGTSTGRELGKTLPFAVSPTAMAVGNDDVRYYRGASVGNAILIGIIGVLIVSSCFTWGLWQSRVATPAASAHATAMRAMARLRFPSSMFFPVMLLQDGLVSGSATAVIRGTSAYRVWDVLWLVLLLLVLVGGVAWAVLVTHFRRGAFWDQLRYEDVSDGGSTNPDTPSLSYRIRFWLWPRGSWAGVGEGMETSVMLANGVPAKLGDDSAARHSVLFSRYHPAAKTFLAVDCGSAFLSSLLRGMTDARESAACRRTAWLIFAVNLMFLGFAVWRRPYTTHAKNAILVVMAGVTTLAALLLAFASLSSPWDLVMLEWAGAAAGAAIYVSVGAFYVFVLQRYRGWRLRRQLAKEALDGGELGSPLLVHEVDGAETLTPPSNGVAADNESDDFMFAVENDFSAGPSVKNYNIELDSIEDGPPGPSHDGEGDELDSLLDGIDSEGEDDAEDVDPLVLEVLEAQRELRQEIVDGLETSVAAEKLLR